MHAAAAVDAEGKLRHALLAARLRFGRIALVAFEPGDQQPISSSAARWDRATTAPGAGAAARSALRSAVARRAGEACLLLRCFCACFSCGFSQRLRRRHHRNARRLLCGVRLACSTFSTGVCPASGSRLRPRSAAGRAATRSAWSAAPTGSGARSTMITGALATRIGLAVPVRQQRRGAGSVKAKHQRKAAAPARASGRAQFARACSWRELVRFQPDQRDMQIAGGAQLVHQAIRSP